MAKVDLQVISVGRLMVNYKLGKPDAARIHTSIGGVKTVEKYLKANRAVLRD